MKNALNLNSEPPSHEAARACLLIGRDSHGHWVVRDQKGLHGGIFVDRARALKYAMQDIGRGLRAVIMVPGILELDMSVATPAALRVGNGSARSRRVA